MKSKRKTYISEEEEEEFKKHAREEEKRLEDEFLKEEIQDNEHWKSLTREEKLKFISELFQTYLIYDENEILEELDEERFPGAHELLEEKCEQYDPFTMEEFEDEKSVTRLRYWLRGFTKPYLQCYDTNSLFNYIQSQYKSGRDIKDMMTNAPYAETTLEAIRDRYCKINKLKGSDCPELHKRKTKIATEQENLLLQQAMQAAGQNEEEVQEEIPYEEEMPYEEQHQPPEDDELARAILASLEEF